MNLRTRTRSTMGLSAAAVLLVIVSAGAAHAQTPPATPPATQAPAPVVKEQAPLPGTKWYLGVVSGAQVVARTAPVLGGEFGVRIRKNTQVTFEAGWFKDVVTDSRVDELNSFVTYLQQTQGLPATGKIDGPAWFGLAGLRYVFENTKGIRPYVLVNGGVTRVEYRPEFTLNGQAISSNVIGYGITLGRDLLGPGTHLAYGAGAGFVFGQKWYLDAGARITRINTPDHHTDVRRISLSVGRRF